MLGARGTLARRERGPTIDSNIVLALGLIDERAVGVLGKDLG